MSGGEGERMSLLRSSLEKSQEKLVKKLDQATFLNSMPQVTIPITLNLPSLSLGTGIVIGGPFSRK